MKKPSAKLSGSIAAGISGGLAFLFFCFILQIHPLIAAAVGAAVFAGVTLLLPAGNQKKSAEGIHELIKSTLEEGQKRLMEIRSYASKIKKPSVKGDIEVLCLTFENIMEEYKENPDEFKVILSYYLDSISRIIKQYTELVEAHVRTDETEDAIRKCENIFKTANEALTKRLENKLEDETINLKAEISVLEKTLKTEGLK